ncbi:dipeptide/oligopeptide/nickel ABC transporter permease/ATP-binding protein [Streptomyces sp. NPDC047043]|uniref:dipeptide/oligopeptide/nickel ABC transporter permease/ATP-binding protein n=1 Tax=Streptomyces sp. NPDC047043 TaxID=3154497 RepID=UPI0033FA1485
MPDLLPTTDPARRSGTGSTPTAPEGRLGALRAALCRATVWPALLWLLVVVFVSLGANHLGLQDPASQNLGQVLDGPSAAHWLGTDALGRDVLSRLVHGGGELLLVALIPVFVSYVVGVPLGLLAGYVGGRVDEAVGFLVNVLFSIPAVVFVLAVAAATDNNLTVMTLVMGVTGGGAIVRLVRSSTVAARNLLYVDAARVARLTRRRILGRHILPNVAGPLIVQAFLAYGGIFVFLTSLSFLSLGFDPEKPSWGQMTYEASQNLTQDPWLMVPVGAVVILTIMSINALGSAFLRVMPSQTGGTAVKPRRRSRAAGAVEAAGPEGTSAADATPGGVADGSALLRLEDLTVCIPEARGEDRLVDRVSLVVRRGETLALVGESGSGKTLTALSIAKLLPPQAEVTSGRIVFDGQTVSGLPERRFRRLRGSRIAYVAQEPLRALDPCFTVRSQLVEVIRSHGRVSRSAARRRAAELLSLVGISRVDHVLRSYPHQLSGGMAQRVVIALAISAEPELVVADEPTTALDVTVQAEILDLLQSLRERLGMTLVLITHDMGVVADMADSVAVMRRGRVVETGAVRDVLARPRHEYTRELLRAASSRPRRDRTTPRTPPDGSAPGHHVPEPRVPDRDPRPGLAAPDAADSTIPGRVEP